MRDESERSERVDTVVGGVGGETTCAKGDDVQDVAIGSSLSLGVALGVRGAQRTIIEFFCAGQ